MISEKNLEEYANTLNCAGDIHFLGYRSDRLAYLKSFDIFAMTSPLEGVPRCLMEAGAIETSVVSYDIDGVDQLITQNDTGLLAPLKDKMASQASFLQVYDKAEFAKQLRQHAIAYVNEHYQQFSVTLNVLSLLA